MTSDDVDDSAAPDDGGPGPRHMQIFGWVVAVAIVAVCVYIALL